MALPHHWIQSSAKGMRLRDTIIEMIGCDDTNGIEKLSIEIEREMMRNTNTIARDFWTLWILCQSQVRSSSAWCEGLGNLIKGNTTHVVGKGKSFENIDNLHGWVRIVMIQNKLFHQYVRLQHIIWSIKDLVLQ
eukprot:1091745_1